MPKLIRFSELKQIPVESKWFQVYKLPCESECDCSCGSNAFDIYAIFEPYHFQEVISFLITGKENALLVDTGMGIGNIKAIVERLTNLPVIVVNTHSHFDHVGDNWRFSEVHLLDVPEAVAALEQGYNLPENDENLTLEAYDMPGGIRPDEFWFDYTKLAVKPCKIIPVAEGHVFDLGGCSFRVIATPGHSDDGLMLVDDERKLLFTGDTIYPAPLYAHLSQSNLDVYRDVVHDLAERFFDYTLFCSHNNPMWEGAALHEIAKAFDEVYEKKLSGESTEVERFEFKDFAIYA